MIGANNVRPIEVKAKQPDLELYLRKYRFTTKSSISQLFIADSNMPECFILERPYTGSNSRDNKSTTAINESEAILPDRYEVTLSWSPGFKQIMLILVNVPGRDGIRIHTANKPEQLLGCLAPGTTAGQDSVMGSTDALAKLVGKLLPEMLRGRKVFLNISR